MLGLTKPSNIVLKGYEHNRPLTAVRIDVDWAVMPNIFVVEWHCWSWLPNLRATNL